MILVGRNSDKHHERRWHFAACVAIGAIGLGITTLLQGHLVGSIIALSFATIGIAAATPLFLPSSPSIFRGRPPRAASR
jgi:MFS-type transporter involved in bile tolerance (Atg22 family)